MRTIAELMKQKNRRMELRASDEWIVVRDMLAKKAMIKNSRAVRQAVRFANEYSDLFLLWLRRNNEGHSE